MSDARDERGASDANISSCREFFFTQVQIIAVNENNYGRLDEYESRSEQRKSFMNFQVLKN